MTRPRTKRLREMMEWTITTKRGYKYKDTEWTNTLPCSCCIQYSIRNVSNEKHVWIEEYEHGPQCAIVCDGIIDDLIDTCICLLYTSPSPRDVEESRMPSSA